MTRRRLMLYARPRVAPLGWPHVTGADVPQSGLEYDQVSYLWVVVKPDGSGWTRRTRPDGSINDDGLDFGEDELDDVLERFYESAGPYPFDFRLRVVAYSPSSETTASPVMASKKRNKKSRKKNLIVPPSVPRAPRSRGDRGR